MTRQEYFSGCPTGGQSSDPTQEKDWRQRLAGKHRCLFSCRNLLPLFHCFIWIKYQLQFFLKTWFHCMHMLCYFISYGHHRRIRIVTYIYAQRTRCTVVSVCRETLISNTCPQVALFKKKNYIHKNTTTNTQATQNTKYRCVYRDISRVGYRLGSFRYGCYNDTFKTVPVPKQCLNWYFKKTEAQNDGWRH